MAKTGPFDLYTQEYDNWFEVNRYTYLSELKAIKEQLPAKGKSIEIGVGSGRFASPLGIGIGVDPSSRMRKLADLRGIRTVGGIGEELPFKDGEFDSALMVTTICFLDDVDAAFREAHRILKTNGCLVVGFVDRKSDLGRYYEVNKADSHFYRDATFFSADDVSRLFEDTGFRDMDFVQTIFRRPVDVDSVEPVKPGFGEGSFVAAKGVK